MGMMWKNGGLSGRDTCGRGYSLLAVAIALILLGRDTCGRGYPLLAVHSNCINLVRTQLSPFPVYPVVSSNNPLTDQPTRPTLPSSLSRVVQGQETAICGPDLYHRPGSTSLSSLRQCHPTLANTQPLSSLGNEVLLLRGHTLSPSLSAEE